MNLQGKSGKMNKLGGIGGIIGLIGIVIGAFFVLNYFNVISLSLLYPKYFGSLPRQTIVSRVPVSTPILTPLLQKPQKLPNGLYSADAIFQSYTPLMVRAKTADGAKDFTYDKITALLNVDVFKKTNGTTQFSDPTAFFSQIKSGDLLFVVYSASKSALYVQQIHHMITVK